MFKNKLEINSIDPKAFVLEPLFTDSNTSVITENGSKRGLDFWNEMFRDKPKNNVLLLG
jgi:hypothetical protein